MGLLPNGFDFVGTDIPLRFKIGQLVEILVQITDDNNQNLDITGRSYQAKIGPGGGGTALATFNYTLTDATNGVVKLSLDTSSLSAGMDRMEVWENNTNFLWGGPVEILAKEVA